MYSPIHMKFGQDVLSYDSSFEFNNGSGPLKIWKPGWCTYMAVMKHCFREHLNQRVCLYDVPGQVLK